MSLSYPIVQLNLIEFENITEGHRKALHELFEEELPALLMTYNERLVELTKKCRDGRPDVLVVQVPLCDYREVEWDSSTV